MSPPPKGARRRRVRKRTGVTSSVRCLLGVGTKATVALDELREERLGLSRGPEGWRKGAARHEPSNTEARAKRLA